MKMPIYLYGETILRKKTKPIEAGTDVSNFIADMYDTMYGAKGVGLAAPQIGKDIRLFVVDTSPMVSRNEAGLKKAFINPKLIHEEGAEWAYEEGCLSIPDIKARVYRKEKITLEYFDTDWSKHTQTFEGILARVLQHEYDHLEGILFTDRITPAKRNRLKAKMTKILTKKITCDYKVK